MKKNTITKVFVALFGLLLMTNMFAAGDPSLVSGTGTEEDPYLIGSVADLKEIGNGGTTADFKGKYYKFIADIDFENADQQTLWHNGGFVGHIDGNGFVIKNTRISGQGWLQSHLGMFWNFQGTVKNLGFENIQCTGKIQPWNATSKVAANQGILSNALLPDSKVDFCWATGCSIVGTTGNYSGGLIGVVNDTTATTITNCYADVTFTGAGQFGGIAGMNGGTVTKSAFYGDMTAVAADSAHTVAMNAGQGTVADSYFKTEAGAGQVTTGSTAIAAADLTNESSYPAFDFSTVPGWQMGESYATIRLTLLVTSNVYYEHVGTKNNPKNADTYTNEAGLLIFPPMDSTDYVFQGWYRDAAMTDMVADSVAILADPTAVGDVTFYAKWVPLAVFDITYENLGDAAANNPGTFQNDTAVSLRPVTDYKNGDSLFIGWFEDAAFTMPISSPAITVGVDAGATFYAKWVYRPFIAGGDGSDSLPYLVSTVYDMQNFALVPGWSHFKLINDIDMEGQAYTPINNLSGSFDGNQFVISNLTIMGKGFCNQLSGTIKNLGLEELTVKGGQGTGAFVGAMWNGTEEKPLGLENCYVLGDTISGTGNGVGGLIGFCWTLENVVTNCYADVIVVGPDEVGGLFGRTSFKDASGLSNCAFYGEVISAGANTGAIFGSRHGSSTAGQTLPNSFYYLDDIVSKTDQEGAVGIAWDDLGEESNYPALDFTNVWKIEMIDEDSEKTCAVLNFNPATALKKVKMETLDVYPNPSAGEFFFQLDAHSQVMVNDLSGKLVLKQNGVVGRNSIDLSQRGAGIYLMTIQNPNATSVSKIVVK